MIEKARNLHRHMRQKKYTQVVPVTGEYSISYFVMSFYCGPCSSSLLLVLCLFKCNNHSNSTMSRTFPLQDGQ